MERSSRRLRLIDVNQATRLALGTLSGLLLGAFLAGVWWLQLDGRTCVGGPCDGTPAGDTVLFLGAVLGAVVGCLAAVVASARR